MGLKSIRIFYFLENHNDLFPYLKNRSKMASMGKVIMHKENPYA
jgi:hypothetical protein